MSDPVNPPPARGYSAGQIALIVIGVILLLPGICSLAFVIGMSGELLRSGQRDPYLEPVIVLWLVCFAISAIGVFMIVAARKRARPAP